MRLVINNNFCCRRLIRISIRLMIRKAMSGRGRVRGGRIHIRGSLRNVSRGVAGNFPLMGTIVIGTVMVISGLGTSVLLRSARDKMARGKRAIMGERAQLMLWVF